MTQPRGRSWFLRLYLPLLVVGTFIALWKVQKLGDTLFGSGRPEIRPARNTELPVFERFPYDGAEKGPILLVQTVALHGDPVRPLFWGFSSLLFVRKKAPDAADLDYLERRVSRARLEALLAALLDAPADDSPEAPFRILLRGSGERRVDKAISRPTLEAFMTVLGDEEDEREFLPLGIRLQAEAPLASEDPKAALAWPFPALSFSQLAREGVLICRDSESMRSLRRKLRKRTFFRQGDQVRWVEAVVEPRP